MLNPEGIEMSVKLDSDARFVILKSLFYMLNDMETAISLNPTYTNDAKKETIRRNHDSTMRAVEHVLEL